MKNRESRTLVAFSAFLRKIGLYLGFNYNNAMKYLLIPLLFISVFCYTQNYQLINTSKEVHYLNNQSEIYSIRIDSASILGSDSSFYNHKVLTPTFSSPCSLILTDSSWVGNRIISKNNGDYLFFNKQNDSIIIKSTALINDNWSLFNFSNGDYIEATLITINFQSILGTLDSVKTVVLQAKNSGNINISHPINSKEIIFSKNNGLVQFFNIQNFPNDTSAYLLIGSSNPNIDTTNLTTFDIFNYSVGDEFHYEDNWQDVFSPWFYTFTSRKKIILSKTISLNQDTITYLIEKCETTISNSTPVPSPDTTATLDTITEKIIISNFSKLNKLSFESIDTNLNTFNGGYSIFSINQTHNKRQKTLYDFYNQTSANCWEEIVVDPGPTTSNYIDGLGGGYYDLGQWNNHFYLVYYKKGAVTWGTPIVCNPTSTGISNLKFTANQIKIYPNPFSENLQFQLETQQEFKYTIYDVFGQEVLSGIGTTKDNVINTSFLKQGIYFLQINTKNNQYTKKIIKN